MSWVLALPVLIPLVCAAIAVIVRGHPVVQRAVAIVGSGGLLGSAGTCLFLSAEHGTFALQLGGWPAPFGITFVADLLSATMAVITGVIGLATVVYSRASEDLSPARAPYFQPLLLVMLGGIAGAFVTGDLFNLYVWFEVMLFASFGLLVIGNRPAQLDGAMKYVVLNVLATTFLLLAVALTYGLTGTLNLADLATRMPSLAESSTPTAIAALFVIAFGIKAAVFPLYFWLPPAYPTTSVAVSAVLAGLLTKVGVYGLFRVLTLVFPTQLEVLAPWLGLVAGLTMLSGVLGAVASSEMRTILSVHIVSQIGYMVMALAILGRAALAGGIFYVLHNILVKANLFFIAGLVARAAGSSDLARAGGGLVRSHPGLAVLFAISAASLAGIPPLSGFWAKLMVIDAGLGAGAGVLVTVALVTSALTLYSMTKIWQAVFWGERRAPAAESSPARDEPSTREEVPAPAASAWSYGPVVALTLATLAIGLWPEPVVVLAERAATRLVDRTEYIEAVIGARR